MSVICRTRGKGHYIFIYLYLHLGICKQKYYCCCNVFTFHSIASAGFLNLKNYTHPQCKVQSYLLGRYQFLPLLWHAPKGFFGKPLVPFFSTHLLPLDREIETSSKGICYLPPYSEKGYVGYVPHEENYVYQVKGSMEHKGSLQCLVGKYYLNVMLNHI